MDVIRITVTTVRDEDVYNIWKVYKQLYIEEVDSLMNLLSKNVNPIERDSSIIAKESRISRDSFDRIILKKYGRVYLSEKDDIKEMSSVIKESFEILTGKKFPKDIDAIKTLK